MSRLTISLPADLLALVNREAHRLDTSVSDVIRRALRDKLQVALDGSRRLPIAALGRSR